MWEHLIPQASLMEADSFESETPRTAPFPLLGMLVSRKSLRPSLTELMLARASPAVLKGNNPMRLTTCENFDTLLHLGEEGGDLLERLQPEQAMPGCVLKPHEVGMVQIELSLIQLISEKVP